MRRQICTTLLLAAAMLVATPARAAAQSPTAFSSSSRLNVLPAEGGGNMPAASGSMSGPPRHSIDISAMFVTEYARVALQKSDTFWMNGGATDASFNLHRGLGVAADFSVDTASSVGNGGSATKLDFVAGPRYTIQLAGRNTHPSRIFLQALGGLAHGFNGLYPAPNGVQSSASSGALLMGGGYDLGVGNGWGFRLVEASWVRTMLPNGAGDVQNDVRLSFGVTKRLGRAK